MSESPENKPADQSSSASGQENGNRNRNRSRNRNRNRNRNRDHNGGENKQGGGNKNGNRNRNRNRGGQGQGQGQGRNRSRRPAPQPITLWDKILNFLGLWKPKTVERKRTPKPERDQNQPDRQAPKVNTRNAKSRGQKKRARQTPDASAVKGTRLYVGNLSYDANESDLEDLFKGVGAVRHIDIVYNRNTHRSKGYGFVQMARLEEAKRAVEVLHDQPFMGRTLIVNEAKSDGPAPSDGEPPVTDTPAPDQTPRPATPPAESA